MPRYKLLLEYDGGPFVGWQRQAVGASVQGTLEAAAAVLNGGAIPVLRAAGRTDAGVHALGQVAHLDLARDIEAGRLRDALNAHLRPARVTVLAAAQVSPGFDARHSAVRRRYLYRLLPRRAPPALDARRVWHLPRALDAAAMHAAAQTLLGRHDFTTFRAAECQASGPVRTLERLDVTREGEEVHIHAAARSFLHHQVRAMVGTLADAGTGRLTPGGVRAALDARDRARCGRMAPAGGLYLAGVDYPPGADAAPGHSEPGRTSLG